MRRPRRTVAMTATSGRRGRDQGAPVSEADLPAVVQAFIDGNWDTSLTVRAWWRRLAAAGYAFPAWPEGLGGLGAPAAAARAVTGVLAANGVVGPPTGHVA